MAIFSGVSISDDDKKKIMKNLSSVLQSILDNDPITTVRGVMDALDLEIKE